MASLSRILLVVCPEGPTLRVFTCVARLGFWSRGRIEVVALHSGEPQPDAPLQPEVIAAAVQPLVLRWGIPPGTEVALVLPAAVGGVLCLSAGAPHQEADRNWIETELAVQIPFAPGDVEYEARPRRVNVGNGRSIEVAWLPRTAAVALRTALARIGLALGEIVFRPQLFAASFPAAGRGSGAKELFIEQWPGWCFFHLLADGCVLRTCVAQAHTPREFADRVQLELLSMQAAGEVVSRVVLANLQDRFNKEFEAAVKYAARGIAIERRAADISEMFLRFWRGGATGIWLVPDDPAPLAMIRRLTFAVACCGVLLAAAMTWHTSTIRDEIAALEAREARLRPQYQTLVARERQAASAAAASDAVAEFSAARSEPQAALLAVFNALPRSAWVTRFSFDAGKATVTGRGMDNESVIARLKGQPGASGIAAASGNKLEAGNSDAGRRFRVGFRWTPVASERELTGKKAPQ